MSKFLLYKYVQVFNESFVFDLPGGAGGGNDGSNGDGNGGPNQEVLKNVSLEFLLLDWDRVTKNEVRVNYCCSNICCTY